MADGKGVDSIRRGGGSDGKRGGAELRREGRRRCAAVVVLVVRTDAGREKREETRGGTVRGIQGLRQRLRGRSRQSCRS